MLIFCDFIQDYVFNTNHHLKKYVFLFNTPHFVSFISVYPKHDVYSVHHSFIVRQGVDTVVIWQALFKYYGKMTSLKSLIRLNFAI